MDKFKMKELSKLKFLNRRGEEIKPFTKLEAEFKKPIYAQNGGGRAFVSSSLTDLENCSNKY